MIIFYIVFGFFGFILLVFGITVWILWSRRKLVFTNFMTSSGQWERETWKRSELGKTFKYDEETYKFDIEKCTRDNHNRPIAHYYKGNPEQMQFLYSENNKTIVIKGQELSNKDFTGLLRSKVLRDIFSDDEVISLLWILIIITIVIGLIACILTVTHKPQVVLKYDNQTINIIAEGVKLALKQGMQ